MSKPDKTESLTCPYCEKRFTVGQAREHVEEKKVKMLKLLADEGYGLREIGRLFELHPQTVKNYLAKHADTPVTTAATTPEAEKNA